MLSSFKENILKEKATIGVLGLGVMGKSLARNFASRNIKTAVYNMPLKGEENITKNFVKAFPYSNFLLGENLTAFISKLETPRIILLMIKAGEPVDEMIEKLTPILEKGDMIIDAGNSFYKDSIRRFNHLKNEDLEFVGMGVSGGEEGALKGPAIMPAGSDTAKEKLLPILQKIAAVADEQPCVQWVGQDGAGHFVKMVHNGIEYADMQLLTEIYAIGKHILKYSNDEIADFLEHWKDSAHDSYLLDITIDILRFKEDGNSLLEEILDVAGHKGTGLWTVKMALDLGVPIPTISAAMNERILSGKKKLREVLSPLESLSPNPLKGESVLASASEDKEKPDSPFRGLGGNSLQTTFLFARLIALAEGFDLIKTAAQNYNWKIDMAAVAQLWRGGCIIRSDMLKMVIEAFEKEPNAPHLFATKIFGDFLKNNEAIAFNDFSEIVKCNVPTPALSAAFNYYKSLKTNYLSINLIQAQRDYFGAHTYRKTKERDKIFHTKW